MKQRLTLDDHRVLGVKLSKVYRKCSAIETHNTYRRNRALMSLIRKAERNVRNLRNKLDSLMSVDFYDVNMKALFYYQSDYNVPSWAEVVEELRAVGDMIDGKVPAKIVDLYQRCDGLIREMESAESPVIRHSPG